MFLLFELLAVDGGQRVTTDTNFVFDYKTKLENRSTPVDLWLRPEASTASYLVRKTDQVAYQMVGDQRG